MVNGSSDFPSGRPTESMVNCGIDGPWTFDDPNTPAPKRRKRSDDVFSHVQSFWVQRGVLESKFAAF